MNIPKPSGSSQNYQYQPQFTNFNQPQQPANFQFQPQYIPNQRSPTMPAQQTSTNLPAQQKVPIHTAFFSNIQYNVSAETFIEFAKKYGEIMNMYNLIPKKGLAFVTYYNIKDAKNAVDKANNQMLEGRQVKTNYAKKSSYPQNDPRTTCSALLVRTMPGSKLTLEKIKTEMSKFGEIYSFAELEQNLYFIKFCDIRDAQKAVNERNLLNFGDENVNIDFKIDDEDMEAQQQQQQQFQNQRMTNYPPPPPPPYGFPPFGNQQRAPFPPPPMGNPMYGSAPPPVPPQYFANQGNLHPQQFQIPPMQSQPQQQQYSSSALPKQPINNNNNNTAPGGDYGFLLRH